MIQTKSVTNFLARNQIPPGRRVVSGSIKVCVVQFHRALGDVFAGNPHLRNTKPAVVAVSVVTDFNASAGGTAVPFTSSAGHYDSIEHSRLAPIRRGSTEN